jgi:hypothetical protein
LRLLTSGEQGASFTCDGAPACLGGLLRSPTPGSPPRAPSSHAWKEAYAGERSASAATQDARVELARLSQRVLSIAGKGKNATLPPVLKHGQLEGIILLMSDRALNQ